MWTFLWLKFLETNGEKNKKCMFFTVFSSATLLHWCPFFTWSTHIGEMPNHKVLRVWTQQALPGQSPPYGATQGCGIFEAMSLL